MGQSWAKVRPGQGRVFGAVVSSPPNISAFIAAAVLDQ